MGSRSRRVVGWLATSAVLFFACRTPTQMTVRVRTASPLRCNELQRVQIIVGSSPQAAEARAAAGFSSVDAKQCDGVEEVGSVVVTPDGDRGAVLVIGSFDSTKACTPPTYEGCIVARRSFAFIDHVSGELPITLDVDCRDVPCDAITSCRHGSCVSSDVACADDGTCTSPAEPSDPVVGEEAGSDGPGDRDAPSDGSPAADGGPSDASTDAGFDASTEGGKTNFCPQSAALQCDDGAYCCLDGQTSKWGCRATACDPTSMIQLKCTGALHCSGSTPICCVSNSAPFNSQCADSCPASLCKHDADCKSMMHCAPASVTIGGELFGKCAAGINPGN